MENLATVGFSVASWPCQVIMIVFTLFFHFWFIPYCFAPVNTYTLQRFFYNLWPYQSHFTDGK